MSERLQLKGMLSDLKQKKMKLATGADANVRAMRNILATASVSPLSEIDLESALIHLTEARQQQEDYFRVCADIKKIEKELE